MHSWRDITIADAELSIRATNALKAEGLNTLGEVFDNKWRLRSIKNIGERTRREIIDLIDGYNGDDRIADVLDWARSHVDEIRMIREGRLIVVVPSVRLRAYQEGDQ